jgi:hypothetical protein
MICRRCSGDLVSAIRLTIARCVERYVRPAEDLLNDERVKVTVATGLQPVLQATTLVRYPSEARRNLCTYFATQ